MAAPTWDAILRKQGIGIPPAAKVFGLGSDDALDSLAKSIERNGVVVTLRLWRQTDTDPWQLIDGRRRCAAMGRLPDADLLIEGALSLAERYTGRNPFDLVGALNQERRHSPLEERLKAAEDLVKLEPSLSARQIGRMSGIDHKTAIKVRGVVERRGDVPTSPTRIDTKGRQQPATKPAKPAALKPAPAPAAPPPTAAASRDEWYTPSTILDPARKVLGHFHLDPASCDLAQETVQARRYFTKAEDGLAQVWTGSVWLNPPFSDIASWVSKLIAEYRAGLVTSAILLANNGTCTSWFHAAAEVASALCFPRGRIPFYGPDGETGEAGPVLFCFAQDASRFVEVFGEMGFVAIPAQGQAAQLPEPVETPIAVTEPADIACTRPKGCGYGGCKAEGRCLYEAAAPKPPVVLKPSDAELARQEAQRAAQPTCTRRGGCVNTSRVNGCWRTGRCGHPDGYESATPEIDLAKAAAPSKAVN
jgi:phage N-6-adenine-methyltransferase